MMITRYCPQCGAETMFDDSREFMFCKDHKFSCEGDGQQFDAAEQHLFNSTKKHAGCGTTKSCD